MDRLIQAGRERRARPQASGGFTLIEVMVSLGILAGGLLAVAAAQLYAMQGGSSGRHTSDAAAIAISQLENFGRTDFADLAATAGLWVDAPDPVQTIVQTTPVDDVEMTYTVQWRIRDVEATLKAVDVRVQWDEPKRPGRALILSTQLHDDPPTGG